jgi:hypothetical protein
MPAIGAMDVSLGIMMLVFPVRLILVHLVIWGLWTAALRPLSGDSIWELVERAGNYGVPFAFLLLAGFPRTLRSLVEPLTPDATPPLSEDRERMIAAVLRVTTVMLLFGHGALGAFNDKALLTQHYQSIGLAGTMVGSLTLTEAIGWIEIAAACAVLLKPLPGLLLAICVWKMASESLFMTAGSLPFEWIERGGSYAAPLALAYLMVRQRQSRPRSA